MNKNLIYGFLAVAFVVVGCKSGENNGEIAAVKQVGSVENDSAAAVSDSTASVEVASSAELVEEEKKPYEKVIADTVIDGVKFKRYYFDIHTKDLSDETMLTVPVDGNADANKKIIKTLVDDYSLDADSLQQQLESQFDVYAAGDYAEDGDEYHESELVVYPVNVVGMKYVSYILHSSLFWPGEQNHPQWADVYFVFDLNTGETISQDDILDASQESRQAVGVKIHEELVSFAGNEDDIFAEAGSGLLNGNFVFDDKGLTFFYTPYEVGPYMLGEPEVFLSKEWLEPYLKKDGILYEYWFNKK
ncbi:MAG: DUF3298 domain-containing protein [Bacteroidales bacterium]|nr:DUF3298 domain-containing protein [Bacteroidales bacterium]